MIGRRQYALSCLFSYLLFVLFCRVVLSIGMDFVFVCGPYGLLEPICLGSAPVVDRFIGRDK